MKYYHIYVNGHRITTKAMTLADIRVTYGSVRTLESSGHMLVPVENTVKRVIILQ
jgi:hypothetical protein